MSYDIYTGCDKISQSRYGSVTAESRACSKNALQNWDAGVTYKRNTNIDHNSLKFAIRQAVKVQWCVVRPWNKYGESSVNSLINWWTP